MDLERDVDGAAQAGDFRQVVLVGLAAGLSPRAGLWSAGPAGERGRMNIHKARNAHKYPQKHKKMFYTCTQGLFFFQRLQKVFPKIFKTFFLPIFSTRALQYLKMLQEKQFLASLEHILSTQSSEKCVFGLLIFDPSMHGPILTAMRM